MFRVKICGVTREEDGHLVAAAGADAVGLNFYPKSPRFVDPARAASITAALPAEIVKVGLFVNAPVEEVAARFEDLRLDLIQLHGDEPPDYLARLARRPVLRAFRLGPEGLPPILGYLAECGRLGCVPCMILIDAFRQGRYGGTGATADWTVAKDYLADPDRPAMALAGGLSPENVDEAIRAVRPAAVDTASGVESSPGIKDERLVRLFVERARAAFAIL